MKDEESFKKIQVRGRDRRILALKKVKGETGYPIMRYNWELRKTLIGNILLDQQSIVASYNYQMKISQHISPS